MEVGEYHKMHQLEHQNWWYLARVDLIERLIRQHASSFDSILDIGCGAGTLLERYPHIKRMGIETHPVAQKYARDKGITIHDSLNTVHSSFDVILLMDVLEHVKEDRAFLKKALKLLNPNGIVIITVPAFQWLWSKHDELVHHLRRYSKKELVQCIREADADCVHSSYWNASFFLPAWVKKKILSSEESDLSHVNPIINQGMLSILTLENFLSTKTKILPFGTSVYAVVKKKG
ncbi:MAG: methyltransferase domain-containing protein [archaeon]